MAVGARTRFFGSFTNKIDAKGRLATPAAFRRVLDLKTDNRIYCIPSTEFTCIECGGGEYVDNLLAMIDALDPYSPERLGLETTVATQLTPLSVDKEGRIILPDDLRAFAELKEQALFAGAIRSFQIWSPKNFERHLVTMRATASGHKLSLRNPPSARPELGEDR